MKTCTKCKAEKPVAEFSKDKNRKDGLHPHCKACNAIYSAAVYAATPEKFRARKAAAYTDAPEKFRARKAADRASNPEKSRAQNAAWSKANPAKRNAKEAKRHAAKLNATPAWADQGKIKFIYAQASAAGLHVDHVVPLKSKLVCGLHVEHNLRPLAAGPNCSKGNRYWPDMPHSIGAAP